tara:strand:+ start:246 stop:497 length:252 start_codon:yes stop_codon:yes gene_type:complete
MDRIKIEMSRGLRIIQNRYIIYLLIFGISFLLQREILLDIPMGDNKIPLKIKDKNIVINSLFHSFVLVFFIFLIEIFYKECLN